jgi:hypothetical protein
MSADPSAARFRALPAVGAAVTGLVVTVVVWARLSPLSRDTVWGEDSEYFLQQRLVDGPLRTIWRPYAGYEQVVPRLVTDLAVVVQPIERYAVVVTALCCLVTGLIGAAVVVLARDVVPQWPLRVLLGVVPAIVPTAPIEIAGNMANLHWYLLFLAPWVFRAAPRTRWGSGVLTVIALLVTGSEIQTAVFLPLLVVAVRRADGARGRRRVVPVAAAGVLGVVVQVVALVTHPRPATNTAPVGSPLDVIEGYLAQPFGGSWSADVHRVALAVTAHGWAVLVVPALVLLAALVLAAVVGPRSTALMIGVLAVGSVVVWVAAVVFNPQTSMLWSRLTDAELVANDPFRYAAAASMFLLAAVVVAASALVGAVRGAPRLRRLALPVLGWVLVAAVVASGVGNAAGVVSRRSTGPSWSAGVRAARSVCDADRSASVFIKGAPGSPEWGASVPCRVVLGGEP